MLGPVAEGLPPASEKSLFAFVEAGLQPGASGLGSPLPLERDLTEEKSKSSRFAKTAKHAAPPFLLRSGLCFTPLPAQILLYESRAEMNVHLDERAIPGGFEAVNLAGLDDENVPSATFKRLSVHDPYSAAFPDKLDLVVGMPMRPRTPSGL
jgi:hypothetical protein